MNCFIHFELSKLGQQYEFSNRQASQYGSRLDWSRDKFCQSLYENPSPKPVLFVGKAINYHINDSETIYNESSQVLTDPQNKLKHKIEAFQDYYILFLKEGTLLSFLFIISALAASFSPLMCGPLVSSDIDRWGKMYGIFQNNMKCDLT